MPLADYQTGSSGDLCLFVALAAQQMGWEGKEWKEIPHWRQYLAENLPKHAKLSGCPAKVSEQAKLLLMFSMWLQAADERRVCSLRTLNKRQEMDEVGYDRNEMSLVVIDWLTFNVWAAMNWKQKWLLFPPSLYKDFTIYKTFVVFWL